MNSKLNFWKKIVFSKFNIKSKKSRVKNSHHIDVAGRVRRIEIKKLKNFSILLFSKIYFVMQTTCSICVKSSEIFFFTATQRSIRPIFRSVAIEWNISRLFLAFVLGLSCKLNCDFFRKKLGRIYARFLSQIFRPKSPTQKTGDKRGQ